MKSKPVIAAVLLLTSNIAAQTRFRTPEQIPSQIMTAELQAVGGSGAERLSNANRLIVLGMWAAWCGPCRSQMPELNKIAVKYRDRGLSVVGFVSLEGRANSDEVIQYLRQMEVDFKSFWITKDISESLDPDHLLPITYVLVSDGTVIRTFLGWNNKKTPKLLRKSIKYALKAQSTKVSKQ